MENIDLEQEKKEQQEFKKIFTAQAKITKEFKYLEEIDVQRFQSEFIKTQAKEICRYLERLSLMPFKAWETVIKGSDQRVLWIEEKNLYNMNYAKYFF